MRTNALLAAGLLSSFTLAPALGGGCQCINDDNFTRQDDAGFPEPDAGPPPPIFPLKKGDALTIPQYGGRTSVCDAGGEAGDCDRNIKATYLITDVAIDDSNRWNITADAIYEGLADKVPAAALSRLAIENTAAFDTITLGSAVTADDAVFTTDVAPALDDDDYRANNFPFFQASNEIDDGDNGEVFAEGAQAFAEAIDAIDPDAEIESQVAVGKMEAYFRDPIGGEVSLHKLLVQIHPMGFICGWDEILIPFVEGTTARSQGSFQGIENPPLTASFFQPTLTRDGVTYQCQCFSRVCRSNDQTCLDPTDPDAPASAEACNP
jgi:hypothetical protein